MKLCMIIMTLQLIFKIRFSGDVQNTTDDFESAIDFTQPLSKEMGISKDTPDSLTESFTQQTEALTHERSIGSGKIREPLSPTTKEKSTPTSKGEKYFNFKQAFFLIDTF